MAFEGLGERLQATMDRIKSKGKVTESDVKVMMREVRLALLEADVNFKVVKQFVNQVKERALGSDVMQSLTPGQQVIKIVKEELTELMGGENQKINLANKPPTVIMMVGLQGAGKTTTAGKLALHLRKNFNKKPMLVAGDIYRPAAIDQLETVGKQIDVPVFSLGDQVKPQQIVTEAMEHAKSEHLDTVIIDTAGRLHIDDRAGRRQLLQNHSMTCSLQQKIKDQSFTLDDFLAQMDQVKDLGPLDELLKMMPGANKIKGLDKMQMSGKEIDHVQAIIRSMTMQERENPSVINASRKKRIARGSGRSLQEVNRLLKQFNEMKKMMKQMTSQKGKKKNPFGNMGLPF